MIVGRSTGLSIGCLYALIYCLSLQGHTWSKDLRMLPHTYDSI